MEFNQPRGIYQQIADHVRERIAVGEWLAGEKIASVREMAIDMGVNPNTVARSYQALLDARIIENRRGIGYFVIPTAQEKIMEEMKIQFIGEALPQLFKKMQELNISIAEIVEEYEHSEGDRKK